MNFQILSSPDYFQAHVRSFWAYRSGDLMGKDQVFQPAVDGCPGIVYQRGGQRTLVDHRGKQLPRLFIYGQATRAEQIFSNAPFTLVGASLHPQGLKSILGLDAHELTDGCMELGTPELLDSLETGGTVARQVSLLAYYLADLHEQNQFAADHRIDFALAEIIRHKGNLPLSELQRMIGMSERSMERRFKQSVGISPKLFSRVCRFQQALHQLNHEGFIKLSDIAYGNNYADQSHFIRDFKRFAGFTPLRYHALEDYFVKRLPELI